MTRDDLHELDAMLEDLIRVAYKRGMPRTFADRVWSVRDMLKDPNLLTERAVASGDGWERR